MSELEFKKFKLRACTLKRDFKSAAKARQFAKKGGYKQKPYLCPFCNVYHLTTK